MWNRIKAAHAQIENRWLAYAWAFCVLLIFGVFLQMRSAVQTSYFGIAEAKEIGVAFEFPVTIKRIHVIPGQKIAKGDLLVELDQRDLELKINSARLGLEELRSQVRVNEQLAAEVRRPRRVKGQKDERSEASPLSYEIARIEAELDLLSMQKKALRSFAEFDGTVVTVSHTTGETLSPYTPVLTLSRSSPVTVVGFIEENVRSSAELDQEVIISSLPDPSRRVVGKIAALGNRIAPFPRRLVPVPNLEVFGREVVIAIPAQNPLIVGEKVRVTSLGESGVGLFPTALARTGR